MVSLKGGVVATLVALTAVPVAAARTQVHAWARDGYTEVRLMVSGLPANRTFGAHVHTGRCGTDGAPPARWCSTPTRRTP